MQGTHGVKVKTFDSKRAQWLTSKGNLTSKRLHAAMSTSERAADYAKDIEESNPKIAEWARPEALFAA